MKGELLSFEKKMKNRFLSSALNSARAKFEF